MKLHTLLIIGLSAATLAACTQTQPVAGGPGRLDTTGTYYEPTTPNQGVGENMRNSTAGETSDRMSTRYPVGSANSGSNPY